MIHEMAYHAAASLPTIPVVVAPLPTAAAGATQAAAAGATAAGGASGDTLGVANTVAVPLMNAAVYLIPAAVAIASLHKLLDHQTTGAGLLVEILTKAGGAFLIVQLLKTVVGLN
jgi:hypothetical protein